MAVGVEATERGILANRGFLSYFGMYLTSRSAFQVANVGLVWLVFVVTHSALDVAIVGIANTLATTLVTLPVGVWIDRVDRRKLLLVSNTVSTLCLIVLTLLTVTHVFQIVFVIAIVFVWAAAGELYRSTSYSVLPDIVGANELSNANGMTQSGYQIISSLSTFLGGGFIVIAGAALTFLYGTIGYGLAAVFSASLYRLRGGAVNRPQPRSGPGDVSQRRDMVREIREGFSWLLTQRGLLGLSLMALVFNFLGGIPTYFVVVYVSVALKGNAFLFGGVLAAFVAGAAMGALTAGRTPRVLPHAGKLNILSFGAVGGSMLFLLGAFPVAAIALVATLGYGFAVGFGNNLWLTAAQNIVPSRMRGRYFAIDGFLSFVGGPPSIAVGGILVAVIGVTRTFELGGALTLVAALLFSLIGSLWRLDGRPLRARE